MRYSKQYFWKPKMNHIYKSKKTIKWYSGEGMHSDTTYTDVVYQDKNGNEQKATFFVKDDVCSIKIGKKIVEKNIKELKIRKYYKIEWAGKKNLAEGSRDRYWKYIAKELK